MEFTNSYAGLDPEAVKAAETRVNQLIHHKVAGYTSADRDDLMQDLMIHVCRHLPQYDASRSKRNTFIAFILNSKVASLIASRKAAMRDYRRTCSLNDPIRTPFENNTDYYMEMSDFLDTDGYLRLTSRQPYPNREEERANEKLDVAKMLENLPEKLLNICNMLQTMTVTEIAEITGIHRSTVYEAIARLKAICSAE